MSVHIAPDLYTKPPVNPTPGARWDYRSYLLTASWLTTSPSCFLVVGVLPANCRLYNYRLELAALDTGSPLAIVFSVGILNSYYNEALAGVSGWKFNAAAVQTAASYNSNSVTDTGSTPALVSGLNILTASTLGQTGGSIVAGAGVTKEGTTTLAFMSAIGVDTKWDRLIAMQVTTAPTTGAAITVYSAACYDQA